MPKMGEIDSIQAVWMYIYVKGSTRKMKFKFYFSHTHESQVPLNKSVPLTFSHIFCWRQIRLKTKA